jgi:hypothetical protein
MTAMTKLRQLMTRPPSIRNVFGDQQGLAIRRHLDQGRRGFDGEAFGELGRQQIDRLSEILMQPLPGGPADVAIDPRGDQDGLALGIDMLLRPGEFVGIGAVEHEETAGEGQSGQRIDRGAGRNQKPAVVIAKLVFRRDRRIEPANAMLARFGQLDERGAPPIGGDRLHGVGLDIGLR